MYSRNPTKTCYSSSTFINLHLTPNQIFFSSHFAAKEEAHDFPACSGGACGFPLTSA